MSITDAQLLALATKWRTQARTYTQEAHESDNIRDIHRLVGMASSLEFAARDLCWTSNIEPSVRATVTNSEASHACILTGVQLSEEPEEPRG